jgi:hypothetical protein
MTSLRATIGPLMFGVVVLAGANHVPATQAESFVVDSARWKLDGKAAPAEYLGRRCLLLEGGRASLRDFENVGYSDDVSVFLNGTILYRGTSAQRFHDPGFLELSIQRTT